MEAALLYPAQCYLGEAPLWHSKRKSCFWVDIGGSILFEYNWFDTSIKTWQFDYTITLVLQDENDELIISLNTAIARFDLVSGGITWLFDIEKIKENRCNDGRCDGLGRLWVGTMHRKHITGKGALYHINGDNQVVKKVADTTISNGLAWSADNTRLYFIDSPTQAVQCYIYDEATAAITFERNVIEIPVSMGTPDGMAIDEEGKLWIAHWGGFGVYRWDPFTGKHLDTIKVPVPNVSSCAFAGENLDHLIITTARENLTEDDLERYPGSGDLFLALPGVKGVKAFKCRV